MGFTFLPSATCHSAAAVVNKTKVSVLHWPFVMVTLAGDQVSEEKVNDAG